MASSVSFTLNSGYEIPAIGLGTWQSPDEEVYTAVTTALKCGYHHIDAALCYGNEKVVGRALKDSGVPREKYFLTSKLWCSGHTRVAEELDKSLADLGVDYLDLYLMHWPLTLNPEGNHPLFPTKPDGSRDLLADDVWNYVDTWASMQKLVATGKVRSIGVANFSTVHLERLLSSPSTTIVPAVNQVELHPYNPQFRLLSYCKSKGIHVTAYSPLGSTAAPLQDEPVIKKIAEAVGHSPAQVLIAWGVWRGTSVIPKSVTPSRIVANLVDFTLPDEYGPLIDRISETTQRRIVRPNWGVPIFLDDE
ncbi:NADP-dependent oxidoreductase domain-containing protein [Limtongia smithiae]|uniref:NADP-dependent oxidoreductase domain-containing protein n=1 Tax=Limtongia smithiae TaxID=1125753 RepID=UPI0034CE76AC